MEIQTIRIHRLLGLLVKLQAVVRGTCGEDLEEKEVREAPEDLVLVSKREKWMSPLDSL